MLAQMTSRQFAEWQAYYRLEPWGEERADLRSGIIAATFANAHRAKGAKPAKAEDFMPDFDGRRKQRNMMEAFRLATSGAHDAARPGRRRRA